MNLNCNRNQQILRLTYGNAIRKERTRERGGELINFCAQKRSGQISYSISATNQNYMKELLFLGHSSASRYPNAVVSGN